MTSKSLGCYDGLYTPTPEAEMKKCFVAIALLLIAGCRTGAGKGVPVSSVADVNRSTCSDVNAVSNDDFTGQQVFDLTSRCVFNRDVHNVRIRILSETFKKVLEDGCAGRDSGYGHVVELDLDGHKIQNAGIKVRGNTSRCNPKRQFKIAFDKDEMFSVFQGRESTLEFPENEDRRFFGVEVLNLRASNNDPSNIRERLGGKIYTQAEVAHRTAARGGLVYRSGFTKFYVSFNRRQDEGPEGTFRRLHDGHWYDYKGFYTLAENIDKVFLESRFQEMDEKIKGTLIQADKAQAFFDRERYSRTGFDAKYVKGKKAKKEEQFVKADEMLGELIDLVNSDASEAELAEKIDIENVVNYFAATQLVGHWDSLLAGRNNDNICRYTDGAVGLIGANLKLS